MMMMMVQSLAFGLCFLAITGTVVRAAEMSGYVMDKQCLSICTGVPANTTCTPDRVNSFYQPEKHTGWCLLLSSCVASGYVLMSTEPAGADGKHSILLDFAGEESQANILEFIQDGPSGFFPRVTVEYDETLAEEIDGVIHAQNAIPKDPWEGSSSYDGADTHQVICPDSTSPDLFSNNLCMRSDILVTRMSDMYTIESNGCPNHANMMGSSGKIVNSQPDPSGNPEAAQYESESQGCTGCGGCAACSAACGAGCGASCCAGCGAGCASCSAACGAGCGAGCDGGCGAGCGSCSAGCDGGCGAGCDSCSAKCGAGCDGGCGVCASCGAKCGSCGAECGSCSASCNANPYEPRYQHYTMEIPVNPGEPGKANYFSGDEVVGIMVNGVVLDSHKATWSYDNCNGHADTKHQYHYHIPPKCFLESMGVPAPESASWWINDAGDDVRPYEDMAAQFPFTATSGSPIVGFARDGYPIFGPYDENGQLQRGTEYGGDLDECNGKMDSNGKYGYYLTVDPPFAPPCLRGEKGLFTYYPTDKACPILGIKSTIVEPSSVATLCEKTSFSDVGDCVAAGTFADNQSNAPAGLVGATVAAAAAVTAAVFGRL